MYLIQKLFLQVLQPWYIHVHLLGYDEAMVGLHYITEIKGGAMWKEVCST